MSSLDASKLTVKTVATRKTYPPKEELSFGKVMSDHILTAEWDAETGWGTPELKPYADFNLDPASAVFHYAFCCFEGQKAFLDSDGKVRIFRPEHNIARLNRSAKRIALPTVDTDAAVELMKKFALAEKEIIPEGRGVALYLRPTLIGTSASLGVSRPTKALFYIIGSPVGPAFSGKSPAVRLKATDDAVRAWPGGTGNAKLGANYSPTIVAYETAAKEGFNQNLWLFNGYVTEVGMMNFFMVFKNSQTGKLELTTYPLEDGLILEGITRLSILELARERLPKDKFDVVERRVHIDEVLERSKNGELVEAFGAGTAAIVTPVKEISFHGESAHLPTGDNVGPIAADVKKWLQDIQYGVDDHVFCQRIE